METVTINDNPCITDNIKFTLLTPDANGCFWENPYKVDKVVIYYVERDFISGNQSEYLNKTYDTTKLRVAEEAEIEACNAEALAEAAEALAETSPTPENIEAAEEARLEANSKRQVAVKTREEAESTVVQSSFYFNEAKPVLILGNEQYPAWLSTDLDNAVITNVPTDKNGNTIYGTFEYIWQPKGMREGDYFICWTWTPLIAGSSLSSHIKFSLMADTQITTSIPTHFTKPEKYETLLERYTPEMYKLVVSDDDRTPDVINKFNQSVALGFTTLEDLANQMVDLLDANSIHESMIPYLSNLFNLKIKTTDPTRWRGQVKRAVPLYKSKGTKRGLREAFEHSAMHLANIDQLWEVISTYTWQEAFVYDGSSQEFELEKVALTLDLDNFELYIRAFDSNSWIELTSDYVEFDTVDGTSYMTWIGDSLLVDPISLQEGDTIRVVYKIATIPNPSIQTLETYLRSLPLMDQRDEREQLYPLKNWNSRLISQNDSLFPLIVPTRHPYQDFIIYGKVRTEFPYSENIYNMEEYNGSIRDSKLPCDIDKNFISPCTACISSCYNLDLEIENLSDDRVAEAREILSEYTPFHSILHTFNFFGGLSEYVQPPQEEIETLVNYRNTDFVIAGEGQLYFNRTMRLWATQGILRDQLANENIVVPITSGTGYNDDIVLFCPSTKLDLVGMRNDNRVKLEILSPSPLAGLYDISAAKGNSAVVDLTSGLPSPASEPIDNCNALFAGNGTINNCAFTFNIKNIQLDGESLCSIETDNIFLFKDPDVDFGALGTKSQFDYDQNPVPANTAWKVLLPAYDALVAFDIIDIMPDGSLILENHTSSLPSTNATSLSYTLKNGLTNVIAGTGDLQVTLRGKVTVLNLLVQPISNIVNTENFYFAAIGDEFKISGFVPNTTDQFYIADFPGPNLGSSNNLIVYQRVVDHEVGYFSYRGIKLQMNGDYETSLGIQNGENSLAVVDDGIENNGFKENFILLIDSDTYFIEEIDGNNPPGYTTFTLSGNDYYWQILESGGTAVNVTIYQYDKLGATIMAQNDFESDHTFTTLDRSGRSVVSYTDQDNNVTTLNAQNGDQIIETVRQSEGITFKIEYQNGKTEKGEII
jgi:hypothetical protein